ncbi:hypothetical protein COV19_01095 [Candidatus Woesearchaeota archaeon CG10_big_fil_rev_8_21_14_0_10_44_13]|nr:MAG: hypothetical protein COV19_01095 [Candidatus Woesearchaeota archaeon CG10_big_fil_rev_8_21_14_0_10_44_13]
MDYISMGDLLTIEKDAENFNVYGTKEEDAASRKEKVLQIKQTARQKFQKFRSFLKWISKKAVFITSVPFYWFIIFRYIVGSIEMNLFIFIVAASFVMSSFGNGWGLLNGIGRLF